MPVKRQILIALKQFDTYRNRSLIYEIVEWAGVGQGTVNLVTWRVMTVILNSNLWAQHVRWPREEEKKATKEWVEAQSIPAFWDGWCMIDGITILIFKKPHYYGESFFDQKSRYSINTQIVNILNWQIIDYATGFNGSHHDTHCFSFIQLAQNHDQLLLEGKWVWSDIGYPLQTWCMIPYKQFLTSVRENWRFNFALSRICICSKHVIGYLKGQFQSLKELCIQINSSKNVTYASCWIQLCIIFHAFNIDNELETDKKWLNNGVTWEWGVWATLR